MSLAKQHHSQNPSFITCGMYAFTDNLRASWQALYDHFIHLASDTHNIDPVLRFDTDEASLRDDNLLVGHTCGYPLMKNLQDKLSPICVPVFDVDGCDGRYCSSTFITSDSSNIQSLSDSYQGIAAFNGRDSNSGMNVLRQAIAPMSQGRPFFSHLIESGSHKQSLIEVNEGRADVAAIDSVSFALIADAWPELVAKLRVFSYSAKTCGLPFVMQRSGLTDIDPRHMTLLLNQALEILQEHHKKTLHLVELVDVELSQYQGILDLEQQAIELGYPDLI